jgi:hypothetical protein
MLVYQRVIGINVDYCGLMGQFHGGFFIENYGCFNGF